LKIEGEASFFSDNRPVAVNQDLARNPVDPEQVEAGYGEKPPLTEKSVLEEPYLYVSEV
jgi:hypothetical protein